MKQQMEKMVFTYDKYMNRVTLGREEQLRQFTVDLAGVQPGNKVLEIGCATGSLSVAAKKKVGNSGSVSAIDIIPGMIKVSSEKAMKANLEIDFKEGSIDNIPFLDSQFDVVICSFMIFHMSEKVRIAGIGEIFRVLKPGGRVLIMDINLPRKSISRAFLKLFLGFLFKHELKELQPPMKATGFREIEISEAKFRVFGFSLISYIRGTR